MPILQKDNVLGDVLGTLIAGYGLSQKMKQQKQAQQRQADIDKQNAALAQAQIAGENARTAQTQQQTQQGATLFPIQERQQGINPATGQPFNYGFTPQQMQKGIQGKDPSSLASFYGQLAARAMIEGATQQAQSFATMANQAQTQAIKAADEALKFQQFAEKQLQDAAQRAHMSAQDQQGWARVSVEAARLQNEVQHGAITAEQAQQNLELRIQELGLRKQQYQLDVKKFNASQNKGPGGRPPIDVEIKAAQAHGITDKQVIGNQLVKAGYPVDQVKAALNGYELPQQ